MAFEGYSPETVDFLWGIRMNNNREWFAAHKDAYVRTLYEPTKALAQELFVPFLDRPGNLLKVSRIYRDMRMHPPEPYKQSLWICIRQDVAWWAENPCLYFEINPEGVDYGFFLWKMPTARMEEFRQSIAARPEEFLAIVAAAEAAAGIPLTAEPYARPKPCDNPALARFFAWKQCISCSVHEDFGEGTFSPALAARVRTHFEHLLPVYEYFTRFRS